MKTEQRRMKNEERTWSIWLNTDEKIASFHYVDTYQVLTLKNYEYFEHLILELGASGYRFQ